MAGTPSLLVAALALLLLVLLLPGHAFLRPLQRFRQQPPRSRPPAAGRPLLAELTQIEVRQATRSDLGAIARARSAVLIVPEAVVGGAGSFRVGTAQVPVTSEEERLIVSRVPYLAQGEAVAFLVEGRDRTQGERTVVAATVDVFVKEAEGFSLPRRLFIKNMIVDPAYRRKGFARRLLARVATYAEEVGVEEVHLEVLPKNDGALALYESEGFELLREPFNLLACALKVGRVAMRKRLTEEPATTARAE